MRHLAAVFALLLFLGLHSSASCASQKYEAPLDAATAKLRIVQHEPLAYSMFLSTYDPVACKLGADIGWLSGGRKIDAERVDMPASEPPKEGVVERKVVAGAPIAVAPSFMVPRVSVLQSIMAVMFPMGATAEDVARFATKSCPALVFTPVAGENYELQLDPKPGECTAQLYRLVVDSAGAVTREELHTSRMTFDKNPKKPLCPSGS